MCTDPCRNCYYKMTNNKKAINVSNKFVRYGNKTIHLNDIIVYTKDPKEKQHYRRVRDIYTNCGNVYISAGLNSFPEILFDYIKIINPQDLSLNDILKMFIYEIRYCVDSHDELVEIYTNIINKKYNERKSPNKTSTKTNCDLKEYTMWNLFYDIITKSNDI